MKAFLPAYPFVVLRNSLMLALEYRFHLIMLFFSSYFTWVIEWAVFSHIYQGREVVGSLAASQAMGFILLGIMIRTASMSWDTMFRTIEEIREGTFRRYLLLPVQHPVLFFSVVIGDKLVTWMALFLFYILAVYFGWIEIHQASMQVLAFFISLAISIVLQCAFYLCVLYLTFWLEETHFIIVAWNIALGVFSGTLIPLDWLAPALQRMLHFTPLPLIGSWPMRSGLGQLEFSEWWGFFFMSLAWTFFFFIFAAFLLKKGLKRYEAFGG